MTKEMAEALRAERSTCNAGGCVVCYKCSVIIKYILEEGVQDGLLARAKARKDA